MASLTVGEVLLPQDYRPHGVAIQLRATPVDVIWSPRDVTKHALSPPSVHGSRAAISVFRQIIIIIS